MVGIFGNDKGLAGLLNTPERITRKQKGRLVIFFIDYKTTEVKKMKDEILKKIQNLFSDTSQSQTQTLEQLEEIRDEVNMYIETLNESGVVD